MKNGFAQFQQNNLQWIQILSWRWSNQINQGCLSFLENMLKNTNNQKRQKIKK